MDRKGKRKSGGSEVIRTAEEDAEFSCEYAAAARDEKRKREGTLRWERKESEHHLELTKLGKGLCFACGSSVKIEKLVAHALLGVPECKSCFRMYHTGTFTLQDGKEMYCRLCGNGGELVYCDEGDRSSGGGCIFAFCFECVGRTFGKIETDRLRVPSEVFTCWICHPAVLDTLRRRLPGYRSGSGDRSMYPSKLKCQALYDDMSRIAQRTPEMAREIKNASQGGVSSSIPSSSAKKRPRVSGASASSGPTPPRPPSVHASEGARRDSSCSSAGGSRRVSGSAPSSRSGGSRGSSGHSGGSGSRHGKKSAGVFFEEDREPMDLSPEEARAWMTGMIPVETHEEYESLLSVGASDVIPPLPAYLPSLLPQSQANPAPEARSAGAKESSNTKGGREGEGATAAGPRGAPEGTNAAELPAWLSANMVPNANGSVAGQLAPFLAPDDGKGTSIGTVRSTSGSFRDSPEASVVPGLVSPEGASSEGGGLKAERSRVAAGVTHVGSPSADASTRAALPVSVEPDGLLVTPAEEYRRSTRERRGSMKMEQLEEMSNMKAGAGRTPGKRGRDGIGPKAGKTPAKKVAPSKPVLSKTPRGGGAVSRKLVGEGPSVVDGEGVGVEVASATRDEVLRGDGTVKSGVLSLKENASRSLRGDGIQRRVVAAVADGRGLDKLATIVAAPLASGAGSMEAAPSSPADGRRSNLPWHSLFSKQSTSRSSGSVGAQVTGKVANAGACVDGKSKPGGMSGDDRCVSGNSSRLNNHAGEIGYKDNGRQDASVEGRSCNKKDGGRVAGSSLEDSGGSPGDVEVLESSAYKLNVDEKNSLVRSAKAAPAHDGGNFWKSFLKRGNVSQSIPVTKETDSCVTGNGVASQGTRGISTLLAEQQQRTRRGGEVDVKVCDLSSDPSEDDDDDDAGASSRSTRRRAERGVLGWDQLFRGSGGGWLRDASKGMEKVHVQVINEVDDEGLPLFRYVTAYVMGKEVQQKDDIDSMACCDCSDGCRDPRHCACLRLQAKDDGSYYEAELLETLGPSAPSNGSKIANGGGLSSSGDQGAGGVEAGSGADEIGRFYSDEGLLLREPRAIYECHAGCSCNPQRCTNRVVSGGVRLRLQVFRCPEPGKGWGLRCMDRIPAGTFVACYLGELLRGPDGDKQGMENGDSYLFNLDKFFSEGEGDDEGWEPHADLLDGDGAGEVQQTSPSAVACSFSPRKAGGMTARDSRPRLAGSSAGLVFDDVGVRSSAAARRERERPESDGHKEGAGSSDAEVVEKEKLSSGGSGSRPPSASKRSRDRSSSDAVIDLCDSDETSTTIVTASGPSQTRQVKGRRRRKVSMKSTHSYREASTSTSSSSEQEDEERVEQDEKEKQKGKEDEVVASAPGEANELVEMFMAATGCTDIARSVFFLDGADNNLSTAVNHFLDFGGNPGASVPGETPSEKPCGKPAGKPASHDSPPPSPELGAESGDKAESTALPPAPDSGTETDDDGPYWAGTGRTTSKRESDGDVSSVVDDGDEPRKTASKTGSAAGVSAAQPGLAGASTPSRSEDEMGRSASESLSGASLEAMREEGTAGEVAKDKRESVAAKGSEEIRRENGGDTRLGEAAGDVKASTTGGGSVKSVEGSSCRAGVSAEKGDTGSGVDKLPGGYVELPPNPSREQLEEWNRREREEWRRQQEQRQRDVHQRRQAPSVCQSNAAASVSPRPSSNGTMDTTVSSPKPDAVVASSKESECDGESRTVEGDGNSFPQVNEVVVLEGDGPASTTDCHVADGSKQAETGASTSESKSESVSSDASQVGPDKTDGTSTLESPPADAPSCDPPAVSDVGSVDLDVPRCRALNVDVGNEVEGDSFSIRSLGLEGKRGREGAKLVADAPASSPAKPGNGDRGSAAVKDVEVVETGSMEEASCGDTSPKVSGAGEPTGTGESKTSASVPEDKGNCVYGSKVESSPVIRSVSQDGSRGQTDESTSPKKGDMAKSDTVSGTAQSVRGPEANQGEVTGVLSAEGLNSATAPESSTGAKDSGASPLPPVSPALASLVDGAVPSSAIPVDAPAQEPPNPTPLAAASSLSEVGSSCFQGQAGLDGSSTEVDGSSTEVEGSSTEVESAPETCARTSAAVEPLPVRRTTTEMDVSPPGEECRDSDLPEGVEGAAVDESSMQAAKSSPGATGSALPTSKCDGVKLSPKGSSEGTSAESRTEGVPSTASPTSSGVLNHSDGKEQGCPRECSQQALFGPSTEVVDETLNTSQEESSRLTPSSSRGNSVARVLDGGDNCQPEEAPSPIKAPTCSGDLDGGAVRAMTLTTSPSNKENAPASSCSTASSGLQQDSERRVCETSGPGGVRAEAVATEHESAGPQPMEVVPEQPSAVEDISAATSGPSENQAVEDAKESRRLPEVKSDVVSSCDPDADVVAVKKEAPVKYVCPGDISNGVSSAPKATGTDADVRAMDVESVEAVSEAEGNPRGERDACQVAKVEGKASSMNALGGLPLVKKAADDASASSSANGMPREGARVKREDKGEEPAVRTTEGRRQTFVKSNEALCVDANAYGNVARFMNHSCDANLTKQMVFVESHDARMPRVAFFALHDIEPYQELTYNYGYVVGDVVGKTMKCRCGSRYCRGYLL